MLIVAVADVTHRPGVVTAALAAGVDAVQLRDRSASGGALLGAARALRTMTRAHGATLLVNDRVDVALAAAADGVHLPGASFPTAIARRLLGANAWIGRSTHSPAEAEAAAANEADYVVLGPIFATPSKQAFGPPLGVAALSGAHPSAPVIAIGGIDATNSGAVRRAGGYGVAVIRAILDADDPAAATRAIRAALAGC
jgi:thiamine-phosphate pyrophosphorylase